MLTMNDENDESIRTIDQEPEQGLIVSFFFISIELYKVFFIF